MAGIPLTQGGPADGGNYECSWANENVQAYLVSDVGKKRAHNEDSCIMCVPEKHQLLEKRGMLFGVADGMGGASSGEFASHLAMDSMVDGYYATPVGNIPTRLREALDDANRRIFEEAFNDASRHGMGTTVSVLLIHGDCAYVAQVGDSRIYISAGRSKAFQVTYDHSLVAEQVRNGYLSQEEAKNHTLKNLITRAVGIKETVKTDLFSFHVRDGDTFLICSDGLSNLVSEAEIGQALRMANLRKAGRLLVKRALDKGGGDNITAVLIRILSVSAKHELEGGATEIIIPRGIFTRVVRKILFPD